MAALYTDSRVNCWSKPLQFLKESLIKLIRASLKSGLY